MTEYLLLTHPEQDRIYLEQSRPAVQAELSRLLPSWEAIPDTVAEVPACVLRGPSPLTEQELAALCRASCYYALFLREGELLRPVEPALWRALPDSLNTILKYPGKTNHRFTRLLVNLAARAADSLRPLPVLLDPMCGQGTTLFEAAIRGWNAIGIETLEQPLHKGQVYFAKYLEHGRYKHSLREERITREGKRLGQSVTVDYAVSREAWQRQDTRFLRFIRGDSTQCSLLLSKGCADVIACDLPYGVQHGAAGKEGLRRDAASLAAACAPGWLWSLRPGGAAALAYNSLTTRREALAQGLEKAGFQVLPPLSGLEHRVDQSILRDVIVAKKPK